MRRNLLMITLSFVLFINCFSNAYSIPEGVLISSGNFIMGMFPETSIAGPGETPARPVIISYDFYLGKYEVTNREFLTFLNDANVSKEGRLNGCEVIEINTSHSDFCFTENGFALKNPEKGNYPVIFIPWWGAVQYCNWLSEKSGLLKAYDGSTGGFLNAQGKETKDIEQVKGYRLPTEAEWEFAAKEALLKEQYPLYSGSDRIDDVGWYLLNSDNSLFPQFEGKGRQPTGKKQPNALGIYDMTGNVLEWCHDSYQTDYSMKSSVSNPDLPDNSNYKTARGGSWNNLALNCRVTKRWPFYPINALDNLGFRIARTR